MVSYSLNLYCTLFLLLEIMSLTPILVSSPESLRPTPPNDSLYPYKIFDYNTMCNYLKKIQCMPSIFTIVQYDIGLALLPLKG